MDGIIGAGMKAVGAKLVRKLRWFGALIAGNNMNILRSFLSKKLKNNSLENLGKAQRVSSLLLGGLILSGLSLSGCAVAYPNGYSTGYSTGYGASSNVIVGVDYGRRGPPPPPYEAIGIAPFFGAIWLPGQWVWRDRWVWHRGQWGGRPAAPRYSQGPGWGYAPPPRYPGYGYGFGRGDDRWRHHDHDDRRGDDRRSYRGHDN